MLFAGCCQDFEMGSSIKTIFCVVYVNFGYDLLVVFGCFWDPGNWGEADNEMIMSWIC